MKKRKKPGKGIGRKWIVGFIALFTIVYLPVEPFTESMTLTTYYPAPYGVYKELRSTENAFLAYNAGGVGIGVTEMDGTEKLRVVGDLRVEGVNYTKGTLTVEDPVTGAKVSLLAKEVSISGFGVKEVMDFGTHMVIDSSQWLHLKCSWVAYSFPGTTPCPPNTRANFMGPVPNSMGGQSKSGWMGCCRLNTF